MEYDPETHHKKENLIALINEKLRGENYSNKELISIYNTLVFYKEMFNTYETLNNASFQERVNLLNEVKPVI